MKYFINWSLDWNRKKDDGKCIRLTNIFSIRKAEENKIIFREECEQFHTKEFISKEEAIKMLQEAIDWIKQ